MSADFFPPALLAAEKATRLGAWSRGGGCSVRVVVCPVVPKSMLLSRGGFQPRAVRRACRHLSSYAIAFDVDGVLLKGNEVVPGATRVLESLRDGGIPHVFMTNGGGSTEFAKAEAMSEKLRVDIDPKQVILGHTPMRGLRKQYSSRHVLVVGKNYDRLLPILSSYGFVDVTTTEQYHLNDPKAYGDLPVSDEQRGDSTNREIDLVCVMNDPLLWGRDLQVIMDVIEQSGHTVPVHNACADLQYASDYPMPRLGNGAFRHAFDALYSAVHGGGAYANQTLYGKPNSISYAFTEQVISEIQAENGHSAPVEAIYMVGDNPDTDILGANSAGGSWKSVLTRSGIFKGGDHDADILVDDVAAAYGRISARHSG